MRLKTKISIACTSVAVLMTVSLGWMYASMHAIRFYNRNVQQNSARLNNYLNLKIFILRCITESFEIYDSKIQHHKNLLQELETYRESKKNVFETLQNINILNTEYQELLTTKPAFLFQMTGHTTHGHIEVQIERTKKIEVLSELILSKIEPENLNPNSDLSITKIVEVLFDGDLNQLISDNIRDQEHDLKLTYKEIESLRKELNTAAIMLLLSTYGTLIYLVIETRYRAVRKLEDLMKALKFYQNGNYCHKVKLQGSDELNELANALNEMASEIVNNQAALSAASKMSALGEMAGGIAHEINNPLGIISARASQIKRLVKREQIDVENIVKFTESIENTTQRIAKIINGLRTFSRNAEKDPFQNASLKDMVHDTLALCVERFKEHEIAVKVEDINTNIKLECRSTQIIQILVNLLNNSHDAVAKLPEKWIQIKIEDNANNVRIRIIDSGQGIAANVLDKLFQPFFTTKEVGKGTGLGLSIARGIVADHHGKLFVDTEFKNTCFVLELPKTQTQPSEKVA